MPMSGRIIPIGITVLCITLGMVVAAVVVTLWPLGGAIDP
jgi:hypothetical protein